MAELQLSLATSPAPHRAQPWGNLPSHPCHGQEGSSVPPRAPPAGPRWARQRGSRAHTCWERPLEHTAPLAPGFPGKCWLQALWLERAAISGSPPGRGGGRACQPRSSVPTYRGKGRSPAQPALTCRARAAAQGSGAPGSQIPCLRGYSSDQHGVSAALPGGHCTCLCQGVRAAHPTTQPWWGCGVGACPCLHPTAPAVRESWRGGCRG